MREVKAQPWSRISRKKPRKSFVKGAPNSKVRQFNMGSDRYYEMQGDLVLESPIQLRDNALEAARQAINKHLEKNLESNYFLQVLKFPHLVIREHTALGVAGADRISKGMKLSFGKPKGRMARIPAGDSVFRARFDKSALTVAKKAFNRGQLKLSGHYTVVLQDITLLPWNLAKKGKAAISFKKKEVEVAKVEEVVPAAGAEGAAQAAVGADGKAPAASATDAKAGGKPAAKGSAPAKDEKKK
ncbi:50S ribosomal protein L16 [Candidatus Micrarchaeota archaeon]|nr:50S ribosomal protein L16 [Candidatus Micrarchaeota archaeon]